MNAVNQFVYRLLQGVLVLLTTTLLVPVGLQILSRFTTVVPRFIWTEEIARFCFVWIVMVGSMLAVRENTHFDLEILPAARTVRGRAIASAVRNLAILALGVTFAWYGIEFAQLGHEQEAELTGLDMAWIHGAWPLAGVVYVMFVLERLAGDLAAFRRGGHGRS
jgi:TRAP-type C4-dicarboxylate transport system permease small subunit